MKTLALALATTAIAATAASAASLGDFDLNGDRFVSYQEATSVNPKVERQEFRSIDVNRDNRLSSVELQAPGVEAILGRGKGGSAGVQSVADISRGSFATESQLAAANPGLKGHEFDIIDTNNDGRVSSVEIYADDAQAILSEHEKGGGVLVTLDAVDTDGSGFASLSELQSVYPGLSRTDLREIDINRDGRIAFNELYDADAIEVLGRNK